MFENFIIVRKVSDRFTPDGQFVDANFMGNGAKTGPRAIQKGDLGVERFELEKEGDQHWRTFHLFVGFE